MTDIKKPMQVVTPEWVEFESTSLIKGLDHPNLILNNTNKGGSIII
tara:strand:+ start:424 stop:561 length:138 start_codon:yes stop_codon:yes gene_type:complete